MDKRAFLFFLDALQIPSSQSLLFLFMFPIAVTSSFALFIPPLRLLFLVLLRWLNYCPSFVNVSTRVTTEEAAPSQDPWRLREWGVKWRPGVDRRNWNEHLVPSRMTMASGDKEQRKSISLRPPHPGINPSSVAVASQSINAEKTDECQ